MYVSYSWSSHTTGDATLQGRDSADREQIVVDLCEAFVQQDEIFVGRDKKLVQTGDSIEDFAAEIASGGLILAVISHQSLRSYWCMVQELLQAFRRRNFSPREFGSDVLALFLDDALPDLNDTGELIDYWSDKLAKDRRNLEKADPLRRGSPDSWKDVDNMEELVQHLPDLIRTLKMRAMPRGAEAIREGGFKAIRALVSQLLIGKKIPFTKKLPSEQKRLEPDDKSDESLAETKLRFVALLLAPAHEHRGDSQGLLFSWQLYLQNEDKAKGYQYQDLSDNRGLPLITEYIQPSIDRPSSESGYSTLTELMQAIVDWLNMRPYGRRCLVEIFVPSELLDVPWGEIPIFNRRSKQSPSSDPFVKHVPYALRSWDRFYNPYYAADLPVLRDKFDKLSGGEGVWFVCRACGDLQALTSSWNKLELVGIKHLNLPRRGQSPIADAGQEKSSRLAWLEGMLMSAAPIAIWRSPQSQSYSQAKSKDLCGHLDEYGDMLLGHKNKDPVASACARFDELPRKRLQLAHDDSRRKVYQFVNQVQFLLDHPDRAPADAVDLPDVQPA